MLVLNKIIHCFIGLCFIANFIPTSINHLWTEKHEHKVHVCDFNSCYQTFEHKCYDHKLIDHKKIPFSDQPNGFRFLYVSSLKYITSTSDLSSQFYVTHLRGPPVKA